MLSHLLDAEQAAAWLRARVPAGGTLRIDSREVRPGDAFIAWPGAATDGRRFVAPALAAGAAACLVEAEGAEDFTFSDGRVIALRGLKAACGPIADAWFDHPGRSLDIVATTGTNGKTSTAWWTAQALTRLGRRAAVVGTLGIGEPPAVQPTGLTTPDPVTLHRALRDLVDAGVRAVAIEASSIGLAEHRLDALPVTVALFTNFTRDHLDFHGSMERYWAAKRALFDWPGLKAAVLNIDDEQGAMLAADIAARASGLPALWTVSTTRAARLAARGLREAAEGLAFDVVETSPGTDPAGASIASTLVGDYNASNLLVVAAGLRALGVPLADACAALGKVGAVPGRLERVAARDLDVLVDYAHTPDALDKVLRALRPRAAARGGRLWCVFGCGGDRDPTKRPLMGAIALERADRVVITSDNPRHEAPAQILAQILAGTHGLPRADGVAVIENRHEAIAHAVGAAEPGDVVLLAGKGHENYQEVAGVRRPFSDLDEARAALAAREARGSRPVQGVAA